MKSVTSHLSQPSSIIAGSNQPERSTVPDSMDRGPVVPEDDHFAYSMSGHKKKVFIHFPKYQKQERSSLLQ
jgi:hypothetical protein